MLKNLDNISTGVMIMILLTSGVTLMTHSGSVSVSTPQTEALIKAKVEQNSKIKVRSVVCPENTTVMIGESYECVGTLSSAGKFNITVTLKNRQGEIELDIPHSKALLNVAKLERLFQQTIQSQTGIQPGIKCGDPYRLNQAGDSFECKMVKSNHLSSILVKIDENNNVLWQEILPSVATSPIQVTAQPTQVPTPQVNLKSGASKPVTSNPIVVSSTSSPKVTKSITQATNTNADSFLNAPNATDGFED